MLQRHALRHLDRRILLTLFKRMGGRIAVDVLMQMQETRMTRLRHASMGVDKRRQCLQGDDEPEHYEAVKSVRHSRIGTDRANGKKWTVSGD
jgi:hypothetical protein